MFSYKNNLGKKSTAIVTLALISCLFFSYPTKADAALWPGIDPEITRMLDTVYDMVQGMILGALKQAAVKMLNSQMDGLMAGQGNNGAAYITNWKDYLVDQPKSETKVYMNSYLSKMTAGKGSSTTGYQAEGFSGGSSYSQTLAQAEKNRFENIDNVPKLSYEGDPSQMFSGKGFKNLELYTSGVNNPWAFNMAAENAYEKQLAEKKAIAQAQAISNQGFRGTTGSNGTITYPGILKKEMAANVDKLPNDVLASAKSIPEVITSIVSQLITKKMQQGFDSIQKSSQSQASSQNKQQSSVNNAAKVSGPSALFKSPSF